MEETNMEKTEFSGIETFPNPSYDDEGNDYKHEWDCYCDVCTLKYYYLEGKEVTKEEYLASDFHKTSKRHYLGLNWT
jgi:hypothetical protein